MQNTLASEKWFILLYLVVGLFVGLFSTLGGRGRKCIVSESNHRRIQEDTKQAVNTENQVVLAQVTPAVYHRER